VLAPLDLVLHPTQEVAVVQVAVHIP
jgi:hypothetical protein